MRFRVGDRVQDVPRRDQHYVVRTGTVWRLRYGRIGVHWDGCERFPGYNRCYNKPSNLVLLPPPPRAVVSEHAEAEKGADQ